MSTYAELRAHISCKSCLSDAILYKGFWEWAIANHRKIVDSYVEGEEVRK